MTTDFSTNTPARRLITAFFDSRTDAEEAVSRLQAAGVARDSVRLVPGHERDTDAVPNPDTSAQGDAGLGLWDSLRDLFLPDEDRATYAEGLRRGGFLVSVSATDAEYEQVLDILDDEGSIDIDERADSWRAEGWSGSIATTGATSKLRTGASTGLTGPTGAGLSGASTDRRPDRAPGNESGGVIPIAEERLNVGKRDVSQGRVRVRSYVVESPVSEQVTLREERVEVARRPVDRPLHSAKDAFQERTLEMEQRSEQAVVSKEARVKEELVVKKDVAQRAQTVSDTVRKTEVDVKDERGSRSSGTGTRDR
jgi:uncharacterized protein (TIGR02271 family)